MLQTGVQPRRRVFAATVRAPQCHTSVFIGKTFSGSVYCSRALASAGLQLTDICHPLPVAGKLSQSEADRKQERGVAD